MSPMQQPHLAGAANPHPILLFDGVWKFWSGTVSFVIERDPEARFRFAALQAEAGQQLLARYGLPTGELHTAAVVRGGRAYTKADAALEVAKHLPMPWSWLHALQNSAPCHPARSRRTARGEHVYDRSNEGAL